jgi:O-acetyl-ADP-ribose deacetylase (regulator of RNase III)
MEHVFANGRRLRLLKGDITRIPADAIVNAANAALAGGGGVDGAIHRAGGPVIMLELDRIRAAIGRCPAGSAVVTGAGRLPARFVFHAVGPVYAQEGARAPALLRSCYETCLALAEDRALRSLSFPAIATGVYGYPVAEAAAIAVETVARHLAGTARSLEEALLVLFDEAAYEAHRRAAGTCLSGSV